MEGPTIMTEASVKVRLRRSNALLHECVHGINSDLQVVEVDIMTALITVMGVMVVSKKKN